MKKIFNIIFLLFSKKEKRVFFILNLINILQSLFEIISLGIIGIFISVASGKTELLIKINSKLPFNSNIDIFSLGFFCVLFYFFNFVLSLYFNLKSHKFSQKIIFSLSNSLFKYLITRNWLDHTKVSLSEIYKTISNDLGIVSQSIIIPLVNILNKLFIAISILGTLFFFNYKITLIGIFFYGIIYFFVTKYVSKIIKKLSILLSDIRTGQFKIIQDAFVGYKEVILFNLRDKFIGDYHNLSSKLIVPQSNINSIQQIPRIVIEFVTYIFIIISILFILKSEKIINTSDTLPILAVFGIAAIKLLPAFQQIYLAVVRLKSGKVALFLLKEKLLKGKKINSSYLSKINFSKKVKLHNDIKLNNVSFKYPGAKLQSLKNINLTINKNSILGLVGHSGSGKSTLADIISGLILPTKGTILVDGKKISKNNFKILNAITGIVPQIPYFSNSSIYENISFKKNLTLTEMQRIKLILKNVELEQLVNKRFKKLTANLLDRALDISGGERQRLSIARCLFYDSSVIILDEATNALDPITEEKVIKSLKKIKNKTIIMIAHRINTLKVCDNIILLKNGNIVGSGKYGSLYKKNSYFKKLINVKKNSI